MTKPAAKFYAVADINGPITVRIDAETASEAREWFAAEEENVRIKYLEMCMGWRFQHPDRYNQDDEWKRLLGYGSIVPVLVSVVDA